jgi:outer membrane protein TolC
MRNVDTLAYIGLSAWLVVSSGTTAQAQTPVQKSAAAAPATLKLTVDDAVRMALGDNLDLTADRLDPEIGDTQVAAANAAFKPTFNTTVQRNNQLQPPASFLVPIPTRNDVMTSNVGLNQRLPWFGTSYNLAWDSSHTDSNSVINAYNPLLRSGVSLNVSQPLLRDFKTDASRLQLVTSRLSRDVAGSRLKESAVRTAAAVKSAYWNLLAAQANVESRTTALELAQELVRVNRAKVDVGQSPPLDLVSAEAEVASNQEQLIIAETNVRRVEDRLRLLIFDTTDRDVWNIKLEPTDTPPVGTAALDLDAAVSNALRDRADLVRARLGLSTADSVVQFTNNQRLPDVRVNASYQASGLGGTEIMRTGGFPGTIVGPGNVTPFGSVLDQLFRSNYPTWAFGVSVSYPIGHSTQEATYARSKLERSQAETRVKSAEGRVVQQIRDAGWQVEMNAKRVETSRAAASLAEQRLDAERKRFEVGMSTSFLVIQAQRDFVQARTNQLAAILAYNLALVDFDSLQQAPPAGQSLQTTTAETPTVPAVQAAPPGAARSIGPISASGIPGF